MKTLYVTDLDGTLLNRNDTISEFSITAINRMVEEGMIFTYATARSMVSASVVTKGLTTKIPVIAYNGTFVFDAKTGDILYSCAFTNEGKTYIQDLFKYYQISPIVYSYIENEQKVSWNVNALNDGKLRYVGLRKGDKRLRPLIGENNLYDGDVFYYTCIGEKEELQPIYEDIKENPNYTCVFQQELYRPEYWLEIMPKNATKANAILEVKKMFQCDRIISFGDAINDIQMFQISDECYAVENAVSQLKEYATGIIESNDSDGVAKWLCAHWKQLDQVRRNLSGDVWYTS